MMLDSNINKKVPKIDSEGKYGNRFEMFEIDEDTLRNLHVSEETIKKINKSSDIVFIPVATVLKRSFFPSVHMMIHSLFDSDMFAEWINKPSGNIDKISAAMSILSDFNAKDPSERYEMLSFG